MTGATAVTADLLREMPLPQPSDSGDKDERGRVLVVAGSPEVPGGALLAGVAALRAGAGKLQIATAASIAPHLGLAVPEALVIALPETPGGGLAEGALEAVLPRAQRCDALVIGPGILDEAGAAALAGGLLERLDGPAFVLDAGALMRLRDLREPMRRQGGRVVVTPHAGEMAGLLGVEREAVAADPLGTAREAAAMLQSVVVLKGPVTSIVVPQGGAWSFSQGGVGLATSGSGDTLAGIVAGLLARGASPLQAALWGVYLHGEAGNRLVRAQGNLGFLARELLAEIPRIMQDLKS
jgi:ADP-dependent NAD(P)H-hydrate dehydratase